MRALRGVPCHARAVYFRSTYFDGVAHMAGCAVGDGRSMRARFNDKGITGVLRQRIVAKNRFVAVVDGDFGPPFRVVATRVSG